VEQSQYVDAGVRTRGNGEVTVTYTRHAAEDV